MRTFVRPLTGAIVRVNSTWQFLRRSPNPLVAATAASRASLRAMQLGWAWSQAERLAIPAALVLLLVGAVVLRVRHLPAADGILNIDEARLTLAAQGTATHGLPVFPTGKLYTRGLIQSLLMAPSVALVEPIELAARLPSVLAGVALVLVMYAYGRQLAGPGAGLLAAAFTATSVPLIASSRQAWLYSIFVLLWMLSLYLLDRAVSSGSRRSLLMGLGIGGLSFLAHEFALAILPAIAVAVFFYMSAVPGRLARLWPILAASLLVGLGLTLMAGFSLLLRSDTVGGTLSEIRGSLAFRPDLDGFTAYLSRLVPGKALWLLGPIALASLLLAGRPLRLRLLLPLLGAGPLLVLISFLLSQRPGRYVVPLVPIFLLFTAVGLALVADRVRSRLSKRWTAAVIAALSLLVLAAQTEPSRLVPSRIRDRVETSWVARLHQAGYKPGDIVLSNNPTVTYVYLGRTDYWLRSHVFQKYVRQHDDRLRDIHTDAILVRDVGELEKALRSVKRGRSAWVVAWKSPFHWGSALDVGVRSQVEQRATQQLQAQDWLIYELRLR